MANDDLYDAIMFEHDFCVALNMMSGQSFDEASNSAKQWMAEAREDDPQENPKKEIPNLKRIRNGRQQNNSG